MTYNLIAHTATINSAHSRGRPGAMKDNRIVAINTMMAISHPIEIVSPGASLHAGMSLPPMLEVLDLTLTFLCAGFRSIRSQVPTLTRHQPVAALHSSDRHEAVSLSAPRTTTETPHAVSPCPALLRRKEDYCLHHRLHHSSHSAWKTLQTEHREDRAASSEERPHLHR